MPIRTVSNAGGNWNATATWVGAVVPIAGDSIDFTATSGNLTVNVASAVLVGVNFTNYLGTITFNNTINTSGVLNLGTGGYTQAGANGITLNGTATLTSGGVTWSRPLTFGGTSVTYTLVGNWTVTGLITFQGSGTTTFTNNTFNINGGLTQTTAGIYAGTTAIVFGGTGTWSNSSTGAIRNNTTINGTITISGNVYYDTGTLTYTAGTVTVTGSTLNIGANTTLNTNGITWNNINTTGTTTITLSSNLTLTGTLTVSTGTLSFTLGGNNLVTTNASISVAGSSTLTLPSNLTCINLTTTSGGGGNSTLNGSQLSITGNLTINGLNNINVGLKGTTNLILTGTGTWSSTFLGGITNNLTINTAGTITISSNVYYYDNTLTYTAGTVTTTGSTLNIGSGANSTTTTLNTSGITWNNFNTQTTTAITTITLSSNLTVAGDLSLSATTGNITFNGFTVTVSGNLTRTGTSIASGTTNIVLNGTGTWSHASTGVLRNNLTINTAGTITISGNVYYDTGTLTYTAGTVTTTGSTLNIFASTTLATNGISWNNVTLGGSTNYAITLSNNLTIGGNFLFSTTGTSAVTMNGNTMNIGGNLTITGNSVLTGTTALVLNGTGTWSSSGGGIIRNNLTVNTAGTLTISGNVYYNTGTFTYTTAAGVTTTGSTLNIGVATTLNTNGITWNNITTTTAVVITLGSNLTLTGTLSIGNGTTSFTLGGFSLISTNANLTMLGANATFTMPSNQTFKTLTITGTNATINSNTLTITENLTINNALSGTTTIVYAGTGTWTANTAGSLISNILTINTAGTLTISGTVYKQTGLFTYTAGTIDDTTGTVAVSALTLNLSGFTFRKFLVNNTITLTSNLNATTFGTWNANAITFTLGAFSLNFTHLELGNTGTTTLPTAWVCQNIELVATSSTIINANSITITGNLTQSGAGFYSGTTTFTYSVPALSTGTWSRTGAGRLQNNLTINSAGTINFTGGIIGGGIFTYTAGTVNVQVASTLYNASAGTTFNGAGITWYNVVFGLPSGIGSITTAILNTQLICIGTLTLQRSDTTFSGTNGTFDTYNLILGTDTSLLNTTILVSTRTYRVRQSFTSTQTTDAVRVLLRSTIGGSQAIFTLDNGSTIDVGFVNATDINSSLGRPIYSYKGVFSNTLNWSLLPVDVTTTAFTFVL